VTALRRSRLLRGLAGLALVLLFMLHDLGLRPLPLLSSIDRQLYDGRQAALDPAPDPRIVIVDVDAPRPDGRVDTALSPAGFAGLVERIFERGRPAVVGIGAPLLDAYPEGRLDPALVEVLDGRAAVLGYRLTAARGELRSEGIDPQVVLSRSEAAERGLPLAEVGPASAAPPAPTGAPAIASGFFNAFDGAGIDADGTLRALPMLALRGDDVYLSFGPSVLRLWLGDATLSARDDGLTLTGTRGSIRIAVSQGYTAMVPFAGRRGRDVSRFRYVAARDILEGRADFAAFDDRIVLLGSSLPRLADLRRTPVSEAYPGIEVHAALIAGALDERIKRRPAEAGTVSAATTLVAGGALALALPALGPIGTVLACGVALLTLIGGNVIAYSNFHLVLPLAAGVAAVALLAVFNLVFGYLAEGRSRQAVLRLFGEYLSPAVVEQMASDPVRWQIAESRNAELTILFADIRGFTRMAESMDPAALRDYLNTVFTGLSNIIHWHGGTVDKYIGDAVMAFWGAPVDDPEHAEHAVEAAIAMQQEARRMSANFVMRGLPPLTIGIGINTGLARVGDMGSEVRRTYTALGDAVNLASRLESLTKRYDVPIMVGEATVRAVRRHRFDELVPALIDGRTEPVRVYAPVMPAPATADDTDETRERARPRGFVQAAGNNKDNGGSVPTGALHEGTGPRV